MKLRKILYKIGIKKPLEKKVNYLRYNGLTQEKLN